MLTGFSQTALTNAQLTTRLIAAEGKITTLQSQSSTNLTTDKNQDASIKALQDHKTIVVGGTVGKGINVDTLTINFPAVDYKPAFDSTGKVAKVAATTSSALLGYKRQFDTLKLKVDTMSIKLNDLIKQVANLPGVDLSTNPIIKSLQAFDDAVKSTLEKFNNTLTSKADETNLNDAKAKLDAIELKLTKMLQALQ